MPSHTKAMQLPNLTPKSALINFLSEPKSKQEITDFALMAKDGKINVKDLLTLNFHKNEQVAFRSSWILENVFLNYPSLFIPYTNYFLEKFFLQKNLSCCRHYGKILALMTEKNASKELKEIIQNTNTKPLVEIVFSWLIDEKMPVAVKSHCLNILANLTAKHSWIKEELLETMDFLVDKESIAFYAKVKQIKKQLK
ncbi:MAG: hypothetical protein EOO87_09665 [Pedobacter sp.]|nr:MAG: hypothetical protein EOO87_09665 [Pedobacter sp.]